jgi:NAD(P)H-dependent FMN reductase
MTDPLEPLHAPGRPLSIPVLLGTPRRGRMSEPVARFVLSQVAALPGVETRLFDVRELGLPTDDAGEAIKDPAFSTAMMHADALVVVTPEYNHSFPAPLKNLIDWHRAEWQAKPVAFVSYGGVSGGLRAVEHLRQVFAELHAVSIRDTVSFHNAGALFDGDRRHRDPVAVDAAAKTLLDQLVWWGQALREAKSVRPYGD